MFHYSAPFDHSHSAPSPFTHFPLSSHATSKPFLPPSYATYDEERSRIEQALLARKQQERRQAEAAAFLAEQRRLERQAAIEEAIREERERREYERALRYREEMVRKAREEEEVKQRYIQAMRVQQELARREQQEQRRRTERATEQQRPIDQSSSLDTVPDLFRLLFGGRSTQDEPVSVSQPSTPSPVQPQPSHSEQPKLDLPHFLEAIFGTPQPSTNAQASPAPRQATAPVSHPSPSPVAQTSSSVPALALQTGAPSCTPIVHQEPPADSPSSDEEEEAARKVQRQFRRHLARRNALDKISSLSSSFLDRQSSFEKPTTLTFKDSSPTVTSSTTTPSLAFVSSNSPFLAYEDYLVNLLSKIDVVESGGDRQVKKERKSLVRNVEKELSRLDAMKERAWEEQVKAAQVATVESKAEAKVEPEAEVVETEQEVAAEETSPSATVPQTLPSEELSPSVDASLPTSSPETDTTLPYADSAPAPPSDDDLEPLIPTDDQNPTSKLTEEAVSSLPPRSTDIVSSPAFDDASSTTSSTLTEASDDSITGEEVSRQAEKLGQEVKKLELAENTDRNEEYVFVL